MSIEYIRRACKISCDILNECVNSFYLFKTEADVADWLKNKTKNNGCRLAFNPLIVSGNNFLEVHHKKIQAFSLLHTEVD